MNRIEFAAPKGFEVPQDVADGDEFQSLATLRVKGDKLCLVELDEFKMPGYDEKGDSKDSPDEYATGAMARMEQPQPEGGY